MSNDRTLTSNSSNDEALIKALRDNAWEYQIPGELILQAANRIEQLAGNKSPSNETLPVERSAVSDARLQTMIDKPSGRDRHAALLELQRWRAGASQKAVPVDPRNCPQCGPHPNDSSEEHTRKAHTLAGLFNGSESEEV